MKHSWANRKICLGLFSSVVFLTLAMQQVDWGRTASTLRDADWLLACLGIVAGVATIVTFAFRWRLLLSSTAEVSVNDTFSYITIGYLANMVFPLRLGEVARAVLLGRRHGISSSLVFGSVVLERTLDLLTVLILALAMSFVVNIPPVIRAGMMTLAAAGLVALGTLLIIARGGEHILAFVRKLPGFVPRILVESIVALVPRFAAGLATLRDRRALGSALCLSVLAWAIAGAATVSYIEAFRLRAPWYAGLFVLTVTNLGSAIPSSPGFIGVYHYLAVLALSVWIPDKSEALAYAIGTHGISVLVHILLGCMCLAREGVTLKSIGTRSEIVIQEPSSSQDPNVESLVLSHVSPTDGNR